LNLIPVNSQNDPNVRNPQGRSSNTVLPATSPSYQNNPNAKKI